MIFLIQKLWIDSYENDSSRAIGYENIGYVFNEDVAKEKVLAAGVREGTGWPIMKGETKPILRYEKVKECNDNNREH